MEIERNRKNRTIKISQRTYIENITEKFGLLDANPVYVPIDSSYKPTANDIDKAQKRPNFNEFVTLFRSIIGSCMYAQMLTRCDICSFCAFQAFK